MKRYSTTSIRAYAPAEDPNGEWVKYEEEIERERKIQCKVREELALWILDNGFSAGHENAVKDLLLELSWQIYELREKRG